MFRFVRRGSRPLALRLVAVLAASLLAGGTPPPAGAGSVAGPSAAAVPGPGDAAAADTLSPDCSWSRDPVAAADALLDDRYQLGVWPETTLPHDLAWTEDPYHAANWRFELHSLRYLLDLVEAGARTGQAAYSDRALEVAADWVRDNPRGGAASPAAWANHQTAWRAIVLTCIADQLPWPDWLEASLRVHGETLADPDFYVEHGNHALNQSLALLEVGRVLGGQRWVDLASARIGALVTENVDAQGVTDEQSVHYQLYDWRRYGVVRARFEALGIPVPAAFARVERMPDMLAFATLPWGAYELLGDTPDEPAAAIPGTWAEFAATGGASGPKPPTRIRRFAAGYLFARSGWGEARAFRDETALSLRWSPGTQLHGHDDGGSLTLAAWGGRLLLDPGMYAYGSSPWRSYFLSRAAHNVVTVDGARWRSDRPTALRSVATTARYLDVRLRTAGYAGVVHDRRVTWSRGLDYLVVEDRLTSKESHTYRQLWHLPPGSDPALGTTAVRTRRAGGNVLVRQLAGDVRLRVVTGRTSPIQGWVSLAYGTRRRAPVVEAIKRGRTVRYVTLVVPARGRPDVTVLSFATRPGGYALRVRVGGRTERLVVDGSTVRVTEG